MFKRWMLLIGLAMTWAVSAAEPAPGAPSAGGREERMTFGGGCFWCLEAVFQRLKGVTRVVSGYAGGTVPNPSYEAVCEGTTGHAEVVQITFDPAVISYETLLKVFWAAHDPTSVLEQDTVKAGRKYPKGTAYQGADVGTQYRSVILFETEAQRVAAEASRKVAQKDHPKPIATEIVALKTFYAAEDYHQNYYNQNQTRNSYCGYVITPKLQKLLKKGLILPEPVLGQERKKGVGPGR